MAPYRHLNDRLKSRVLTCTEVTRDYVASHGENLTGDYLQVCLTPESRLQVRKHLSFLTLNAQYPHIVAGQRSDVNCWLLWNRDCCFWLYTLIGNQQSNDTAQTHMMREAC